MQGPEIRCAAARWTRGNASHEPVLRRVEMGGYEVWVVNFTQIGSQRTAEGAPRSVRSRSVDDPGLVDVTRRGPFLDESPLDLRRCKLFAVSVKTVWVGFRLDRPGEVADPIGLAPHQDRDLQFMEAQHRAGHASGAVPGRGGTDRPGRRRQETRWGRPPSETETADRLDFNI